MIDSTVLGASAVVCLVVAVLFTITRCVRYVGNNRVAVVEKLWSRRGSITAGLIALSREAGYQPVVLRGVHPGQLRLRSTASARASFRAGRPTFRLPDVYRWYTGPEET